LAVKVIKSLKAELQGYVMFKQFSGHFDEMALAIVIWMCTLPLVGLLILPYFGLKISLLTAVALLIGVVVICRGICSWKICR